MFFFKQKGVRKYVGLSHGKRLPINAIMNGNIDKV